MLESMRSWTKGFARINLAGVTMNQLTKASCSGELIVSLEVAASFILF